MQLNLDGKTVRFQFHNYELKINAMVFPPN